MKVSKDYLIKQPKVKNTVKNKEIEEDKKVIKVDLGDRLKHNKFGLGTVIDKPKEDIIKIKFDDIGEKVLSIDISFTKGFLKFVNEGS